MNRRDLLKRLGAAGLVAATLDVPRFWSLDRTMIPNYWDQDIDIRYTAQVTSPPFDWAFIIDDSRYPVMPIQEHEFIPAFARKITIGVPNE